jgi:tetratricopeptide (TPR) repeat protein
MADQQMTLPPDFESRQALVEQRFLQGLDRAHQRQFQLALEDFKACLAIAATNQVPLYIEQFVNILMEIAFCYADLLNRAEAFRTYSIIERVLKREHDWFRFIPKEVQLLMPADYNPMPQLARLYESLAIAFDNSDEYARAVEYYQQAIDIFMQLGDKPRAAQTWHYVAMGRRRCQDWTNLELAGENLLALHEPVGNLNGMIEAWQCLAQARMNQGYALDMLEYQKRAVAAERQLHHPDLARDEKVLDDFNASLTAVLRDKVRRQQSSGHPSPFDSGNSYRWLEMFEKVSVRKVSERGSTQLEFVVHTQHFEAAAYLLRIFPLTLLPVNLALMRQLPMAPGTKFPEGGHVMIEWSLTDPDPGHVIDSTVIPHNLHEQLAAANSASKSFTVMLEEKQGRFGKTRSDAIPGRYDPYLIDWGGALGYVTYVRTAWHTVTREKVDLLVQAIQGRLTNKGPATGLYTELGYLYRLNEEWGKAIDSYLQEIRFGLKRDGRPGVGTMQAFCNLGVVYKKMGDPVRARDCFAIALHLNPNYFEPLISVAGVLEDFTQQLICLSRAYRIRPGDPVFSAAIQNFCGDHPHVIDEVGQWIKAMSADIDLAQRLSELDSGDPRLVMKRLGI